MTTQCDTLLHCGTWSPPPKTVWQSPAAHVRNGTMSIKRYRRVLDRLRLALQQTAIKQWTVFKSCVLTTLFILLSCNTVEASSHSTNGLVAPFGKLVFDHSEPPLRPLRLHVRQAPSESTQSTVPTSTSSSISNPTGTSTLAGFSTAAPTQQTVLPTPFDSSLGNNFTSPACPAFFQHFLTNDTFKQCLPLSMLLQVRTMHSQI
jgi:hypothetical protein